MKIRKRECVGIIAVSDSNMIIEDRHGRGWWGEKTRHWKTQKMEKYHLPELSRIITYSSHNHLQYSDQNGSHFKIPLYINI